MAVPVAVFVVRRMETWPMVSGMSFPMAHWVVVGVIGDVRCCGLRASHASPTMSPGLPMSRMAVVMAGWLTAHDAARN